LPANFLKCFWFLIILAQQSILENIIKLWTSLRLKHCPFFLRIMFINFTRQTLQIFVQHSSSIILDFPARKVLVCSRSRGLRQAGKKKFPGDFSQKNQINSGLKENFFKVQISFIIDFVCNTWEINGDWVDWNQL